MDWRYNQMWSMMPVVVGTFIETVQIIDVPVPVDPFAMQLPPPAAVPTVLMQQNHYQFMAQGVVPDPAAVQLAAAQEEAAQHAAVQQAAAQPDKTKLDDTKPDETKPEAVQPTVPPVAVTPAKAGGVDDYLEVNTWNAAQFSSHILYFLRDCSPSLWHQIIVRTPVPENERGQVISAINKLISPMKLIPYFFGMEDYIRDPGSKRISFYVNMCTVPLKALCERKLTVPYDYGKFYEIALILRLSKKTFNLSDTLKEIVSRRLDSENKFLDLSYINDIPEVQEMLYDPTDNWHILDNLLWIAKRMATGLTALSLAGNGIVKLGLLEGFLLHSNWKSLRTLDLSDNEIMSTMGVFMPPTLHISEVYLDNNPLCQMPDKDSYIRELKVTFPRLKKLDGTYLHTIAGLPYWKPNFIADSTGDASELADQFMEHFFTLYDDSDRMKLRGLYHKNACFSLSCSFLRAQSTTSNARLSAYKGEAQNLLQKKLRAALTRGSEKILERLSKLPGTQHDPYTFTVDLTVHTLKMTILTVTGIFHDISEGKNSHLHFARTFVLTGEGNGEYQITNDILYISNATTRETEEAFQFGRPPKGIRKNRPSSNLSESEKESMIKTVQQLTNMSAELSRKCLEDTDWNLKKSLEIVILESKLGICHSK